MLTLESTKDKEINKLINTLELFRKHTINIELMKYILPSNMNEEDLNELLKSYEITIEETNELVLLNESKSEIIVKGTFEEILDYLKCNYDNLFGEFHEKTMETLSSKRFSQVYPRDMYAPQNNKLLPQLGNMSNLKDVMNELNKVKLFNAKFTVKEL